MTTAVIIISLLFTVLILSYKTSGRKHKYKSRKNTIRTTSAHEKTKKAALNIPGYYEDIVNKDKLTKNYKWELHDSI